MGRLLRLQTQLTRAILAEQAAIPNIAPHHLHPPMAGLIHYGSLRCTRDGRACGVPGPQRMARVFGGIKARPVGKLLHDTRYVVRRQPAPLYLAMPIE